ncbi:MAG: hypothetical protein U0836_13385 [Pirellulales bacterium]
MTPAPLASGGAALRTVAPHPRPWPRRVHFVRRAHLFFGLFMIPWAAALRRHGVLINHPAFPWRPSPTWIRAATSGPLVAALPAAQLAAQVTDAWNAKLSAAGSEQRLQLEQPELAQLLGRYGSPPARRGADREYDVEIDLPSGQMRVQQRPGHDAPPFASAEGLTVPDLWSKRAEAEIASAFARAGLPVLQTKLEHAPPLMFSVVDDQQRIWHIDHNLLAGSARAVSPTPLPLRQYLLGMHYSARYPSHFGTRWAWAIAVDATAAAFVFWSVSGILMWWQIKATRRWGFVSLAASLAVAGLLAWHMYATLGGSH